MLERLSGKSRTHSLTLSGDSDAFRALTSSLHRVIYGEMFRELWYITHLPLIEAMVITRWTNTQTLSNQFYKVYRETRAYAD